MNRTSYATTVPGRDTSVRAAVERLTGAGFRDAFSCERGGIRSARTGRLVPTDHFRVVEELRFDGASDPDQQVLLLALDGGEEALRGTLLVTHGHAADACQANVLRRLARGAPRGESATDRVVWGPGPRPPRPGS